MQKIENGTIMRLNADSIRNGTILKVSSEGSKLLHDPISVKIKNIVSSVVTTEVSHGLFNDDQIRVSGIGADAGMVELNGNVYTVKEKTENTFKLYDKDGNSIVDTSGYQSYVENTTAGGRIDRITGKLVSIEGNKQASGVMLDISATSLVSGTGMKKITSGEKMTSGKLLDLVTTSSQAQEGVFSLAADSVEDGVIVKISSDQIKRGSIVI